MQAERRCVDILKHLSSPELTYWPEGEISALQLLLEQPYQLAAT